MARMYICFIICMYMYRGANNAGERERQRGEGNCNANTRLLYLQACLMCISVYTNCASLQFLIAHVLCASCVHTCAYWKKNLEINRVICMRMLSSFFQYGL